MKQEAEELSTRDHIGQAADQSFYGRGFEKTTGLASPAPTAPTGPCTASWPLRSTDLGRLDWRGDWATSWLRLLARAAWVDVKMVAEPVKSRA
jgi:hypothetical protein